MDMLTGIAIVSAVVKLIVDRVRKQWPGLDATLVNIVALGIGVAATWVPDVITLETGSWVERVTAGALIAGVSSLFADVASSTYGKGSGGVGV